MKVGISATADAATTIRRCEELGVERVYIPCATMPGYRETGHPDARALQALKQDLVSAGLEVPSACYWFAKWPPQPGDWRSGRSTNPAPVLSRDRKCIDGMLEMIRVLGGVGIDSVLHYVDLGRPDSDAEAEACWESLVAIYEELMPVAEAAGVALGNHSLHRLLPDGLREEAVSAGVRLEDFGTYRAEGWGGPFLVDTPDALARLVEAVPSPSNGVTLCTGMDIVGGDAPSLVKRFTGKIHFCQLRDHTERWPGGREVLPGEGHVDLGGVVRALKDDGYAGIVQPEHLGKPAREGEDRLAPAVCTVKGLLEDTGL